MTTLARTTLCSMCRLITYASCLVHVLQGNDALFPIPPGIPVTPEYVYEQLLDAYGFGGISKWEAIPILIASLVVFRIATYCALRFINYERR